MEFAMEQPDGSIIIVRARGDRFFSWYETAEGYPIKLDPETQEWRYMDPTTHAATNTVVGKGPPPAPAPWSPTASEAAVARRQAAALSVRSVPLPLDKGFTVNPRTLNSEGLVAAGAAPSLAGAMAVLCAKYADMQSQAVTDPTVFQNQLFDATPGKLSMSNLYSQMSFGSFTVSGGPAGVTGWFTVPGTRASYGANDAEGDDVNPLKFVVDLVAAADATFNFGPYDTDNDGFVDCLAVVAQGKGEEAGGGPNAIWSHQSSISQRRGYDYGTHPQLTNDVNALGMPVYVDRYFICAEKLPVGKTTATVPQTVGIFCHEYGHALGLPDLYDHDNNDAKGGSLGLGDWSLMAGGSWNQDSIQGDHPCWMDAWCRVKLGWATVNRISINQVNVPIPEAKTVPTVYRLWTNGNGGKQYFLVENRQRTGFDSQLPGNGGLFIYHVDDNVTTGNDREWYWKNGAGTVGPTHYQVALEQADGKFNLERLTKGDAVSGEGSNSGDDGDAWVSGGDFDSYTTPSSNAYITSGSGIGAPSYVAVKNISAAGAMMTADFYVSPNRDFPVMGITVPGVDNEVFDHLTEFDGTAYDPDSVDEVAVFLREDKVGGRYWNFNANVWQSTKNDTLQKGIATGTGGLTWGRMMNDAAFADGFYIVSVRGTDTNHATGYDVERRFRIQRDMTIPGMAIYPPGTSPLNALPVMRGIATDNVGIKEKHFRLYSVSLGLYFNWAGGGFDSADPLLHPLVVNTGDESWTVNLPTSLANGEYEFSAEAVDTTDQVSLLRTIRFDLQIAPVVAIGGSLHRRYVKTMPEITGTAAAPEFATLVGGHVFLTIRRGDMYWSGSGWVSAATEVHATVGGDGHWSYPSSSVDPGASLPTDDGVYAVSVRVVDSQGRESRSVLPGLAGNTGIQFTIDNVPPDCTIDSPVEGWVIESPPVNGKIFHGFAHDDSGRPEVTLFLHRLGDDMYWTSLNWSNQRLSGAVLATFSGGTEASQTNWAYARAFPRLGIRYGSMTNGQYEFIAVARDAAGNETTATAHVTVDWNPVWLRPQDELVDTLPAQVTPVPLASVGSSVHATFSPRSGSLDFRQFSPAMMMTDSAGRVFTAAYAHGSAVSSDGILQRLGAGGWRRERSTYFLPADPKPGDVLTYYEQWYPGGPDLEISEEEFGSYSFFNGAAVDAAGNVYAAYTLAPAIFGQIYSDRILAVKFDASGNMIWRRMVEQPATGVNKILPLPDGGAALIIYRSINTFGYSSSEVGMLRISSGGGAGQAVMFGHDDGGDFDPQLVAAPLFADSDAVGNVFMASSEFLVGGTGNILVMRKFNSSGTVTSTLEVDPGETPENWLQMKVDALGNVYVLSYFDVSSTDRRVCVTRYDNDLNFVWRAFGPVNSVAGDNVVTAWTPRIHVGAFGITVAHEAPGQGYYSEFPYEHGQVTRFSPSGDMLWSRPFAGTDASLFAGDSIQNMEVDSSGNVLFIAQLNTPDSAGKYAYGKISVLGDLQFLKDLPALSDFALGGTALINGTQMLVLNARGAGAAPPDDNMQILLLDNPANVQLPVVLDEDQPADQTVVAGAAVALRVINRGSPSSYQWRKENGSGVPQNISGAIGGVLRLTHVSTADAGRYSVVVTNGLNNATSRTALLTVLEPVDLAVALDTPGRVWTTGGTAPWAGFVPGGPAPAHDGIDAAMPGKIETGQTSWIETTVNGPGKVSFWWKTSSQFARDEAEFSIDGEIVGLLSGEEIWRSITQTYGEGQHVLRWAYHKGSRQLGSPAFAGQDRMWLDEVTIAESVPLDIAVDTPGRAWNTTGASAWSGVTAPSHDGTDAAVSGRLFNNQQSSMETTVTGPGTISFWVKVSSDGGDAFQFLVDNVSRGGAAGETDWLHKEFSIPAGSHVLRWMYAKDDFFSAGLDCAFVDQIVYETDGPLAPVASTDAATFVFSKRATLNATINPKRAATVVTFEYGTVSGALSSISPASNLIAGINTNQSIARELTGLLPNTTYYYRAKAVNTEGVSYGEEVAFTTAAPGIPDIAVLLEPAGTELLDGGPGVGFGAVGVRDFAYQTLTVKNTGTDDLSGLTINVDGVNAAEFLPSAASLAPLPQMGTAALAIQFKPTVAGVRSAVLHIASNDPDENPFDIELAGTGTPSPAAAEIAVEYPVLANAVDGATTMEFGAVVRGGSSVVSFNVRNVGGTKLTGIAAAISGVNGGDFTVSTKPAASLLPGAFTPVVITFKPGAEGSRSAVLKIASNDADENPFDIQLIGSGYAATAPAFTLSPTAQMVALGSAVHFYAAATGDPAPTFQWRKGAAGVAGAKGNDYHITGVTMAQAGAYSVVATNVAGSTPSGTAELGVVDMSTQNLVLASGGNISLTVNAAGNALGYVWQRNGTALAGSTHYVDVGKKTLTIKGLGTGDTGIYTCQVTGAAGTRTCGARTITVFDQKPDITPLQSGDALPAGIVSRVYTYQVPMDAAPEKAPSSFTATGLPPGLSINNAGLISGVPTAAKTGTGGAAASYAIKVAAVNAKGKDEVNVTLFIAPLPAGAVGVFEGPIVRQDVLNGGLGGRFDLTTKTTGSFSGKLTLGTASHGFAGVLATDAAGLLPTGTAVIPRKNLPSLTVSFTIDSANRRIDIGDITDGSAHAPLSAWQKSWGTANPAGAYDGYYTFGWDMQPGFPAAPQGTGFGSFTVAEVAGTLTLKGKTGDGETLVGSAFVGPQGQILIFQLLYAPVKGSLAGSMLIDRGADLLDDDDNILGGSITWLRPANSPATTRTYKDGFATAHLLAGGGRYLPPALILGVSPGPNNARLVFADAAIDTPPPAPGISLGIGALNAITYPASNPRKTTLKFTLATGEFSGGFTMEDSNPLPPPATPAVVKRAATYQGIIVREGGVHRGYGYFLIPQLPSAGPPQTSPTTSPILSGQVVFERP